MLPLDLKLEQEGSSSMSCLKEPTRAGLVHSQVHFIADPVCTLSGRSCQPVTEQGSRSRCPGFWL